MENFDKSKSVDKSKENYDFQKIVVIVGVSLFIIKIVSWYLTSSIAILTDALESIVNIITGFIGLYSLYISAKPSDLNHPYGHGKIEYISSSIEGTMIIIAGLFIIVTAVENLIKPKAISELDIGIVLIAITAIINYVLGALAVKKGEKNSSPALIASGKHLQTDTVSTVGIIIGLFVIMVTKLYVLDSIIAMIFALYIIHTGSKIIKQSIEGIMDTADLDLVEDVLAILNKERRPKWIDIHNLGIIRYGNELHVDCHLTVPWYINVREEHEEVEKLENIVKENFENVDIMVHADECEESYCRYCLIKGCHERNNKFIKKKIWTIKSSSKS